eukprot:2941603-Rhodomonas_salina.1
MGANTATKGIAEQTQLQMAHMRAKRGFDLKRVNRNRAVKVHHHLVVKGECGGLRQYRTWRSEPVARSGIANIGHSKHVA